MATGKLYEFIGFVSGLILINYGFSIIAAGLPGTRALTSQFVGFNLLVGGAAVLFMSLYFLLRPVPVFKPTGIQPGGSVPDVGVGLVVRKFRPHSTASTRRLSISDTSSLLLVYSQQQTWLFKCSYLNCTMRRVGGLKFCW